MSKNITSNNIENKIVESFSRHARSYDKHAQLQKSMAERLASMLPRQLPLYVTEIGCGTGVFTRHLLTHHTGHLALNDISPVMLDLLRARMTLPSGTQLVIGNAEIINFAPMDLIAANAVFQWFHNPGETLKHLSRFLNPGGELIFSTFGPGTLQEFRETGSLESPTVLHSFQEWARMIHEADLQVKESHSEFRKTFFPSSLALTRNLQQIGAAPLQLINSGGLRRLIRDYDKKFSTEHGVYATWELLYFSCVR